MCREAHQDGSFHLHAYLKYERKVQWGARRWDLHDEGVVYHGNYTKARCPRACALYAMKDGCYLSNFDPDAVLKKKNSGRVISNKALLEGDLAQMCMAGEFPLMQYPKLKLAKAQLLADTSIPLPRCLDWIPNTWGLVLPVLDAKRRHYWFWSQRPNTGKTTFLVELSKKYPCGWYNYLESYQSFSHNIQFLLLDEYQTARLQVGQLNQMCDGTHQYPIKNGSPVTLTRPIVIICSNKPPEQVYPNCFSLIEARFTPHEL